MFLLRNYNKSELYDYDIVKENKIELNKRKEGEKLSIVSDSMFKAIFQNSNRIEYSVKFLSYFLDISYEELLEKIVLYKNELDKEKENTKSERCDYLALIDDTLIGIEMNNNSSEKILNRNLEYTFRNFSTKMTVGKKKYEYFNSYTFNINNFAFKGNKKIIDIYVLQNEEGLALTNKLVVINIYLPNLMKKWYTEGTEKLNDFEKYMIALVEPNIGKLLSIKKLGDEIVEKFIDEAEKVSFDREIGEAYDKEWALKDEEYSEGKEDAKIEIAKRMIEKEIDIKTIEEVTDLSEDKLLKIMSKNS